MSFHKCGDATEKKRKPWLRRLYVTSNRQWPLADLKLRLGIYLVTRSDKYEGAMPFRHLKVIKKILKIMRCSTGNQCSYCSIGDVCSCLGVSATILAAAFWTCWSRLIVCFGSLYKSELQKSSLEVMKAWTSISALWHNWVATTFFNTFRDKRQVWDGMEAAKFFMIQICLFETRGQRCIF